MNSAVAVAERTYAPSVNIITRLVGLDQLVENPCQPAIRTDKRAIKTLFERVQSSGFITPILVVDNGDGIYTVGDGHRRWTVSELMGYQTIQAQVLPTGTDVVKLFLDCDAGTRKISGRERLTIYARRQDGIDHFPAGIRRDILKMKNELGLREVIRIGMEGKQSPDVVEHVDRILAGLAMHASTRDSATWSEVFYWLTEHAQQRVIVERFKSGAGASAAQMNKLRKAITGNYPWGA